MAGAAVMTPRKTTSALANPENKRAAVRAEIEVDDVLGIRDLPKDEGASGVSPTVVGKHRERQRGRKRIMRSGGAIAYRFGGLVGGEWGIRTNSNHEG
jgi:hypothetical protein